MKQLTRDITITLIVKMLLLFLLWWVCIKALHPIIEPRSHWFFGASESPVPASIHAHEVKK